MDREGIQNIHLFEGDSSNLQTDLTDQDSMREENASGETGVLYGRAKKPESKGELQTAVPVPVPNHEHQMSEDVSVWSTPWRVVKGYLGFRLSSLHPHSIFTGFVVFEAISCLCYLLTGDLGMYLFLFAHFMTFIGIIKTSNAFTMSSINRHSDPVVMGILLSVMFLVFYSCFSLEPKNKESIITASVFRLACYTILVVSLSLRKDFRRSPDDLASHVSEDVSIWSTLWRVVKGCHGFCLSGLHRLSFCKEIIVLKAKLCLWYPLTGGGEIVLHCLPNHFIMNIFDSDFHTSPDDLSHDIQDAVLLYLHQEYKNLALVVLYLILEAISLVLDFIGKGKLGFIVAAFVLALFVSIPTLWVYFKERSIRSQDERPIANVELLFSGIQLLTTLLHLIFELKGVDDKKEHENGTRNAAEPPAENQVSQHENGIRNAAEPPAENQVNQHDGLRNIMVHMRVTGKHLNMVIDLTMVTCYEQLFRKLRDEMFQAMEELWGDRPRWNVLYVDISDEAHYLREDEISWGEFRMAARKICIYRKEVRKELYRRWESMPRTSEKGSERALFT
ncbi:hypothetical protein Patl1_22524 [Pistacia atlantica]|uniref:Uncharacterized protein n=1 Tax=Pistacia atlantica TaxID=434234 RepID=A0ACC0ZUI1_9ROSI|nr:hypothetical protein Patl1_22524 [Pistacia atlantica]